jgi:NAD-dependent dihydropyrimidine dehydrogenase PreA subunit
MISLNFYESQLKVDSRTVTVKDRDRCMECGACALNCPVNAVEVKAGVG